MLILIFQKIKCKSLKKKSYLNLFDCKSYNHVQKLWEKLCELQEKFHHKYDKNILIKILDTGLSFLVSFPSSAGNVRLSDTSRDFEEIDVVDFLVSFFFMAGTFDNAFPVYPDIDGICSTHSSIRFFDSIRFFIFDIFFFLSFFLLIDEKSNL